MAKKTTKRPQGATPICGATWKELDRLIRIQQSALSKGLGLVTLSFHQCPNILLNCLRFMKTHQIIILFVLGCTLTACNRHGDGASTTTTTTTTTDAGLSQAQIAHVHELVTLYSKKEGGDDAAAPELQGLGTKGRDEVIRILDDPKTPKQDNAAAIEILNVIFPSSESYAAIDRFGSRISDPAQRKMFLDIQAAIRKSAPGKQ
jgi:hypothetical protein